MSGLLKVRLDHSDPHSAIIILDSREGNERSGKKLQLQYGQEVLLKMPDYLFDEGEAGSQVERLREERDQLEERVRELEETEASQLVASDETDAHRIRSERAALHHAQENSKALKRIIGHLDPLLGDNLEHLTDQQVDALLRDYGIENEGEKSEKASVLQSHYSHASVAEKAELLIAVLAKLDDKNKRLEVQAHRHADAEAYRDDIHTASAAGDVLGVRSHQGTEEAELAKEEKRRLAEEEADSEQEEKTREDYLREREEQAARELERPSRSEQSAVERDRQASEFSASAAEDAAKHLDSDKKYLGEEDITREPSQKEVIEQHGSEERAAAKRDEETNDAANEVPPSERKDEREAEQEGNSEEVDATDGAKELAEKENVGLHEVEGSGKDGRITKDDVQKHIDSREDS